MVTALVMLNVDRKHIEMSEPCRHERGLGSLLSRQVRFGAIVRVQSNEQIADTITVKISM